MNASLPLLLAVLLLAGSLMPVCARSEEASTNHAAIVAKAKGDLELGILKREYETLRISRVEQLKQIEYVKIEIESYKDKSLRQREAKERMDILQEQLKALDRMIDEARDRLDQALVKQAATASAGE